MSQKSGIGRHQWNVALSELPFVIRVSEQERSTCGHELTLQVWENHQRRLCAYVPFSQDVAPASIFSGLCSQQNDPLSDIFRHNFLFSCVHIHNVSGHFHGCRSLHYFQQSTWSREYFQRHLHIVCSNRSCFETPAIHEEDARYRIYFLDRIHVSYRLL